MTPLFCTIIWLFLPFPILKCHEKNVPDESYLTLPQNLCLIYTGSTDRRQWTADDFIPYLIYENQEEDITLPLFDAFLLIEYRTPEEKLFWGGKNEKELPNVNDWEWLAQVWSPCLNELNKAIERVHKKVFTQNSIGIVITIPEPSPSLRNFGSISPKSPNLNFQTESDRITAIQWYIKKVIANFSSANYSKLKLLGFYWLAESIPPEMENTVIQTAQIIHQANLKFFWIPYFTANNVWAWKNFGFDYMYYQPNYFFEENGGELRLGLTAHRIKRFNCGVEIELDHRILTSNIHQLRFAQYLQAGIQFGWNRKPTAWYQANDTILTLARGNNTNSKKIYQNIAQFITKTYQLSQNIRPIPEYTIPNRENLNLAHRNNGTKVIEPSSGICFSINPEYAIDGDIDCYSGTSGFTCCEIPGEIKIQFPKTVTISRIQILLYNLDDRYYQYRIEISEDSNTWKTVVDKSQGEHRNWQIDTFSPHAFRYLRIIPLYNSSGQNLFQLVELEAYF